NANLQLQSLNESTNRAQERRLLIERQIADTQAIPLPPPPVAPRPSDPSETTSAARQLDAARARLGGLLQRCTPHQAEVVSLEQTVAELATRVDAETPLTSTDPSSDKAITPAEAAQQKKILDLQAELAVIDHQLASSRQEDARLKEIIGAYQAKVDVV